MNAYTAATTNASNRVVATAEDASDTVTIELNGTTEIPNGSMVTWEEGENTLEITVNGYGGVVNVYTVTVTKT